MPWGSSPTARYPEVMVVKWRKVTSGYAAARAGRISLAFVSSLAFAVVDQQAQGGAGENFGEGPNPMNLIQSSPCQMTRPLRTIISS